MKSQPNNNFLSLFSGCGGFDLGFIQAEYDCINAYDIDPLAIEVHKKNLKSNAQIFDLSQGSLPVSSNIDNIDVLLAGPPCQGFSTAGKRRLDDPRNKLILSAAKIAIMIKPTVIIIENVTGVASGEHKIYWEEVQNILRNKDYKTHVLKCEAVKMGVPQKRTRLVLVAWNNGKEIDFNLPKIEGGNLKNALANINNAYNHEIKFLDPNTDFAKIAKHIKPGQKLSNVRNGLRAVHTWEIPEVFGETTSREKLILETMLQIRRSHRVRDFGDADPIPKKLLEEKLGLSIENELDILIKKGFVRQINEHYDLSNTFNGKFRRLLWDQPAPTVITRFGEPRYFLHPVEDRGFTVRETARIQGFPDSFVFNGPTNSQYRLIGNAVPPPLAKCLAQYIKKTILN